MNKFKYLIFTLVVFVMNVHNILAVCTQEEINAFKKIEDNYTIKYEFDKSTKTYNLYFNASKPKEFYYTIYTEDNLNCSAINETTMKCINFASGEYEVEIVGVTNTCNNVMKTIILKLPKYNKFSEDPLCEGIEDFVLCNPTYDKDIDYETFVSRVNTYKKNHQENETETPKTEEETETPNEILDYIVNNWLNIIIISIFVILLIITIIVTYKNARKSRYLE